MIRLLLLLVMTGGLLARASEPIAAPVQGASAVVTQPHVTAELIPEKTTVQPGEPFGVALHLHSDKGWHTYWINPGDSGLATSIKWDLPPGFTAGPIQWPTPEKHNMGPLITYGYEGDVYLITRINIPASMKSIDVRAPTPRFTFTAHASWLVCKEECIPGHADLTLPLDFRQRHIDTSDDTLRAHFFNEAYARLPVPNTVWDVSAFYGDKNLYLNFCRHKDSYVASTVNGYFFPEQPNVLDPKANAGEMDHISINPSFGTRIALQQNGEKPDTLSGVLVSDTPIIGKSNAVHISGFHVLPSPPSNTITVVLSGGALPVASGNPDNAGTPGVAGSPEGATAPPLGTAAATSEGSADDGHRPPLQTETAPPQGTATATNGSLPVTSGTYVPLALSVPSASEPLLLAVLGAAFIGGLILNLMPCVLPVLSLKVFSLMRHAGENPRGAWIQGVAFTAGVVISFWVLAGLLLTLRAAGNQIGWGFQMQSPGFVLALIFLFFLLGLNLFGVFELGTSLAGLDAKATNRMTGLTSSFLNGALATVAATPCTAPFMGGALGFAARQPPLVALLIFTFLALGMAMPYLLLTIFPGALRFVPKPGAWMEALRQFMGFLLMATVIFLVYVFGALVGEGQVPWLLFHLLIWALMAWIYGRWSARHRWIRLLTFAFLVIYVFLMIDGMAILTMGGAGGLSSAKEDESSGWQPWSKAAVDGALAQGRPVFVDFTAAWCLSCKVNERVVLNAGSVRKAFAEKNVVLLRGDWTRSDPAISETLRQYNRDGVPLYLLFSPKGKDKPQVLPQVLPEVLTPGIILEALRNL